jgi:hypothetical protein
MKWLDDEDAIVGAGWILAILFAIILAVIKVLS